MIRALLKKQLLELGAAFVRSSKTGKRRSRAGVFGYALLFIVLMLLVMLSFGAMALPLAGILFIGLFPQTAVSAVTRAAGFFIHHPADAADYLLSPTLAAVSRTVWLLILVVGLLAWLRSRALRTRKVTDGATWGCGFTSPNVRMQYSGESYSEVLQCIATSLTQNSGEGGAVGKG